MAKSDLKVILWGNVSDLMTREWDGENLSRLSKGAKIALASTTRLKGQETSVGVDILERVAKLFKVQPWQLLTPKLGVGANPSPTGLRLALKFDAVSSEADKNALYVKVSQLFEDATIAPAPPSEPVLPAPTRSRTVKT